MVPQAQARPAPGEAGAFQICEAQGVLVNLPINFRRVLIIAGIIVLVLMVMDFNRRIEILNTLNKQAGIQRAQATQAMQTQLALQTQVAFAASTEAVGEWA